jgi:hypothetical protein
MDKKNQIPIKELRDKLEELSHDELTLIIINISKTCPQARDFLTIKLSGQESINKAFENYKQIIKNEFYPKRGIGKLKLSVAKKAIADFKKVSKDNLMIIDLMLYYVENCVKFTNDYGDINERFYVSAESMFKKAIQMINIGDQSLYEHFSKRLDWIIKKATDGWGFRDALTDIYHELRFIE